MGWSSMASTDSMLGRGSTVSRYTHMQYRMKEYTTITRMTAMPPKRR